MTFHRVAGAFLFCLLGLASACGPAVDPSARGDLVAVFRAEDGTVTEGERGPFFVGRAQPGETRSVHLTVKNVGDEAVSLTDIMFLGGAPTRVPGGSAEAAAVFEVAPPAVTTLKPGGRTELEVTFAPVREGRFVSAVQVNNVSVELVGVAERVPVEPKPKLVLAGDGSAVFGQVPYFPSRPTPSVRQVWVTNTGTEMHTIDRIDVRAIGTNSLEEELEVHMPQGSAVSPLAPDNVRPLELRVTPGTLGQKQWEVTLHTSDPLAPELVLTVSADAVAPSGCKLRVSPMQIDFGVVYPPDYRDLVVEVSNEGVAPDAFCLVWDVALSEASASAFTLPDGAIEAKVLAPRSTLTVPVRFSGLPTSPDVQTGLLTFETSSEVHAVVEIPITAQRPAGSCITIVPDELDFGDVNIGCASATRTFNVYNSCRHEVLITSLSMVNGAGQPAGGPDCPGSTACPEFLLIDAPPIPAGGLSLVPGQAPLTFQVKYEPIDVGADTGALAIVSTVRSFKQTHVVSIHGRGEAQGEQTDVFVQDPPPRSDVLFVIDDSPSMADDQTTNATNLAALLQHVVAAGVDFRFAVVNATSSGGTSFLTGPGHPDAVLSPSSPNLAAQFAAKVDVGTSGTGGPRCLEKALDVLTANAGFARPGVPLSVLCITDSADLSPLPVADYLNGFWGIQGPSTFSFNAIGGFSPTCPGDNGVLAGAVAQTNGVEEDICTPDWHKVFEPLGTVPIGPRSVFFLTSVPDLSRGPIVVTIDGQLVPATGTNGEIVWTFDAISNAVTFEPMHVPGSGKLIEITYRSTCVP